MKTIKALVAVSCLAVSAAAGATTWGDDGAAPHTLFSAIGSTSSSIFCAATACQVGTGPIGDNNPFASGAGALKMTAYRTATGNGAGNVAENTTAWVRSKIEIANIGTSSTATNNVMGVGIRSNASATLVDDTSGNNNAVERGIDNNGYDDILVIDFLSSGWDVNSIVLGFACTFTASTTNPTSCSSTTANIQAWIGETAPTAFTGAGGFNAASGFKELVFPAEPSGGASASVVRVDNTDFKGRYLVITGDLSRKVDAFTLKGLSATHFAPPPPPGGNAVPIPGSVPLIALALLALAWVSRSRRLRAIPIRIRR